MQMQIEERTKFENYSKQLSVPFEIYADFECNLQNTKIYEGSSTKKYHDHVPCSYAFKVVCIDNLIIDLVNQLLFTEVKILLMNLLKQFFKNISIVKT